MVQQLSEDEVNIALRAMMMDEDFDLPPIPRAAAAATAAETTAAFAQPAAGPPPTVDCSDAALLAAMDDDWDGTAAKSRPVPAFQTISAADQPSTAVAAAVTSQSMGYLTLTPDAAAALMMPPPPPGVPAAPGAATAAASSADGSYCLPPLSDADDDDEDCNPVDGDEQWQSLPCDIFQDVQLVPTGCASFSVSLGAGRGCIVVHPQRKVFERTSTSSNNSHGAKAAAQPDSGGVGIGADAARMTGALLWDSAVVLARHLVVTLDTLQQGARPREAGAAMHGQDGFVPGAAPALAGFETAGRRVIEVGAGLGLCGLVCAALGHPTLLTDRSECLPLLEEGVGRNQLAGLATVRELEWGDVSAARQLGPMDLVLASDCIYELPMVRPLIETLVALLEGPEGGGGADGNGEAVVGTRAGGEQVHGTAPRPLATIPSVLIAYDEAIGRPEAARTFREGAQAAGFSWHEVNRSTDELAEAKESVKLVRLTLHRTVHAAAAPAAGQVKIK